MMHQSYATIPAEKVTQLCNQAHERVARFRREQEERKIKKLVKKSNQWRRLFGFLGVKLMTYERMSLYLNRFHVDYRHPLYWPRKYGYATLDVAEHLLNLARHGDPVHVTSKDMDFLLGVKEWF